jgi:hypothetical protein
MQGDGVLQGQQIRYFRPTMLVFAGFIPRIEVVPVRPAK